MAGALIGYGAKKLAKKLTKKKTTVPNPKAAARLSALDRMTAHESSPAKGLRRERASGVAKVAGTVAAGAGAKYSADRDKKRGGARVTVENARTRSARELGKMGQ